MSENYNHIKTIFTEVSNMDIFNLGIYGGTLDENMVNTLGRQNATEPKRIDRLDELHKSHDGDLLIISRRIFSEEDDKGDRELQIMIRYFLRKNPDDSYFGYAAELNREQIDEYINYRKDLDSDKTEDINSKPLVKNTQRLINRLRNILPSHKKTESEIPLTYDNKSEHERYELRFEEFGKLRDISPEESSELVKIIKECRKNLPDEWDF